MLYLVLIAITTPDHTFASRTWYVKAKSWVFFVLDGAGQYFADSDPITESNKLNLMSVTKYFTKL